MREKEAMRTQEKGRQIKRTQDIACLCAREREIESSCNSISLALPLGRHSPPPERPTYPFCHHIQPPCSAVFPLCHPFSSPPRVGKLSEVSESYPQPGRFPSEFRLNIIHVAGVEGGTKGIVQPRKETRKPRRLRLSISFFVPHPVRVL